MTTLDIVIINRNTPELTGDCIRSIRETAQKTAVGIIVVDNASTDGSAERIEQEFPDVKMIRLDRNIGYGAAFNRGYVQSTAEYVVVSNSDILYHPGSIDTMVEYMETNPRTGVCAPQQVYPDGRWQASYGNAPGIKDIFSALTALLFVRRFVYSRFWRRWSLDRKAKKVDYLDGAVMCFRRVALDEIKGFDESYLFFVEDADVCRRLQQNKWGVIFMPLAQVTHIRGGTREKDLNKEKHYYAMNMHFRYHFGRKHLGTIHYLLYATLTIGYYALLTAVYSIVCLITLPFSATRYQRVLHKYRLSVHLTRTCYNELLQKNTLTPSLS